MEGKGSHPCGGTHPIPRLNGSPVCVIVDRQDEGKGIGDCGIGDNLQRPGAHPPRVLHRVPKYRILENLAESLTENLDTWPNANTAQTDNDFSNFFGGRNKTQASIVNPSRGSKLL